MTTVNLRKYFYWYKVYENGSISVKFKFTDELRRIQAGLTT